MKYEIGFAMTGTVTIEADDIPEALDNIDMYSKHQLLKYVTKTETTYIVDKETDKKINL